MLTVSLVAIVYVVMGDAVVMHAKWWALGAVSLSVLAVSLDGTVLSVALPTLATELHASESDLEWFSSGYLLLLAAAVLPAGLIGDRYGRKRLLLWSLTAFGAGSALCAFASSSEVFLIARLFMGVAGAGITVMALSALAVLFDDDERPRAVGIYQAANFLALPLGPILGGWMLAHVWWGWVFLLNVPVVAVGVIVALAMVPASRACERPALDLLGTVASVAGLVLLTYGLIEAGQQGWGDADAVALITAGVVIMGGFVAWERRLAERGGEPLIDPALFRSRAFAWGATLGGVAGLGMIGLLFIMPQYFQAVRGVDAFGSGVRLLPLVGGLVAGAVPANRLATAVGEKRTVALGFALLAAGSGIGALTGVASSTAFVAVWMTILCAGAGLALTASTAVALSELSAQRSGIGSAVVQAFQKTSAPFGTAIMGSVLAAAYQGHLHLNGLPSAAATAARQGISDGVVVADQLGSPSLGHAVRAAFVHGMDISLLASAAIAVTGLILAAVFLPPRAGHDNTQTPIRTEADVVWT
jgi:DHA2 family multidrug resistance protein-like MFS transporter